jgi:hypothetical protein
MNRTCNTSPQIGHARRYPNPRVCRGARSVLSAAVFTCRCLGFKRHYLGRKRWKVRRTSLEGFARGLESLSELYDRYAQHVTNTNQI